MMKKLTTIIVATGLGLASGCAMSPNSYQYKADHSRAYNLAQAGGLQEAKDYDVPNDQKGSLTSKGLDATSNAVLFNSGSGFGLDWGQSLGLGLLTSAFAPKGGMERDSVFGWISESQASDKRKAWEMMSSTLFDGIEKSLQQANIKFIVDSKNKYQKFPLVSEFIHSSVRIVAPEHGCPDWEAAGGKYDKTCNISTVVHAPTENAQKTPDFIASGQKSYTFYADDVTDYSRIEVNIPKGANLNKNQLLARISRELPSWAFIFVASQKMDSGGYTAPVILATGKPELFITPQKG